MHSKIQLRSLVSLSFLSFYYALYAYGGWTSLNYVTEEVKDPSKNIPRNIYISLPLVTVIYMLTNVAYLAVLTQVEMLSSNAVAVTFIQHFHLRRLGWSPFVWPLLQSEG
ncbi:y+L amino acid transporter 2 [Caerostris extrusa]|uniref:Y+L amino acid transporter 2 n=1 Tax=Caerostris extrusa TaxID=172846 RepID=A0AAV4Y6W3_CAEEX|nr:y+L amino acid transporter 2 [Caerostris extrusa]